MHRFNRNGVWEDVDEWTWKWEAQYNDGTILKQYDDSGIFHQFAEIAQDKLSLFTVTDGNKNHALVFPLGAKLIHFYRVIVLQNSTIKIVVTVFGYEKDGMKVLLAVMPGGDVVATDDMARIGIFSSEVDTASQI